MDDMLQYRFGFQPESIGNRFVSWWIVDAPDVLLDELDLRNGDMCIVTRDDTLDTLSMSKQNFLCVDRRHGYTYYYYAPLRRTIVKPAFVAL